MIKLSPKARKLHIAKLYHDGCSRNEIARQMRVSPSRITQALRELGLKAAPEIRKRETPPPLFPGVTQIPDDVADVIAAGEHLLTDDHMRRADMSIKQAMAELREIRVMANPGYQERYYEPVAVVIGRRGGIKSAE